MSDEDQPVATAAESPRKPSRRFGFILLSAVMAAVVVVIVMIVMQRQPAVKGEDAPEGVELTITAPKAGTPFTIDGVKAGKTPAAIKIRGRTRAIEVRGNNVLKIVTPDRDQVVNLVP
jgi:hypothetical protein